MPIDHRQGPQSRVTLREAIRGMPNPAYAWYLLGRLYAIEQRYPEALSAAETAIAGQPVTQTLTRPPPSFYTCMAVGSGTICHGTISESSGPEETGLVCGRGADAFNAWQTSSLV